MSTSATISEKNEFWIPKHRYYELKHFCLQYKYWKAHLTLSSSDTLKTASVIYGAKSNGQLNEVEATAIRRDILQKRIDTIERAARESDPVIGEYILKGATQGKSYDELNALYSLPCGREYYYKAYRRFFWILDSLRD